MNTSGSRVDFNSGAVQSYLGILQGVINRMASNSAGCKTWCITLVSAIAVIIADEPNSKHIWLAMVPVTLFVFLDSYYLGLEQRFRGLYNEFIKKLHSGTAEIENVYIVTPGNGFWCTFWSTTKAALSLSVWPFYGLLVVVLSVINRYVM